MVGVAWSWLVHTGMATSSNVFVPSAHSVGESPSQVPGQACSSMWAGQARHTQRHWHLFCHWAYVTVHVFPRRTATRDVWIPEFWVCIRCFASSIMSVYVKNLQFVRTKKLPGVQQCICHDYISLLTESLWSGCSSDRVRVSNFMAAYGRGRSLTRYTTNQQLHLVSLCVKVSAVSHAPYSLQAASI